MVVHSARPLLLVFQIHYTTTPVQYFPRLGQLAFLEIDEGELDTASLHLKRTRLPTREYLLSRHRIWTQQ